MRIVLCLAVLLLLCAAQAGVGLGADTLTNIRPPAGPAAPSGPAPLGLSRALVPGTVVRLPDGRETRILEVTPQGIVTDLGVTLTPEGAVAESGETTPVTVVEPAAPEAPEGTALVPRPGQPDAKQPEGAQVQPIPDAQKNEPGAVVVPETAGAATPEQPATPTTPTTPGASPHQLTIVELLPLTPAPEQAKAEKGAEKKEPEQKPAASEKKPEEKKAAPAKEQKPKEQKPKKEEKPKEKPAQTAKKKPAVGEELRIPPEAVSTGNLDFLEGCWQGTRPEYYSKRMIKECFCFDVHGGAGKRRVIDSIGGRMCIGSSKAKLSKEGVLSVTSSGAACTDGERWGQAEMVCKGTGQRAPCSWVFKDAQGGRQSYEIPFVRVESCGR